MYRPLLAWVVILLAAGCSIPRQTDYTPSELVYLSPETSNLFPPGSQLIESVPEGSCRRPEQRYTSDTINTRQRTIEENAIKRQSIKGTNVVLLRDALISALADTEYPVTTTPGDEPKVVGDTVTITLQRKPIGRGYSLQHYLTATLLPGSGRIALRVTTQVIDPRQRAVRSEVEAGEMDKVLDQVTAELAKEKKQ